MALPTLADIRDYAFQANLALSNLMRIPVLDPILRAPVAILWIVGYTSWYIGSLTDETIDSQKVKNDAWYSFAKFKEQYEISALIGIIAAILLLTIPALVVPISWLFFLSNVFWSIATHHENNVHRINDDKNFSPDVETAYSDLTVAITLLSLNAALWVTLLLIFPLAAPILVPIFTAISITLSLITVALGVNYLLEKYSWKKFKEEDQEELKLKELVENNSDCTSTVSMTLNRPYSHQSLFSKEEEEEEKNTKHPPSPGLDMKKM